MLSLEIKSGMTYNVNQIKTVYILAQVANNQSCSCRYHLDDDWGHILYPYFVLWRDNS